MLHRALGRIRAAQRVVEQHHQAVAQKAFQRAFVLVDERAEARVIFAQHGHDLLGLGGLGERREAAQVAEHDGDVAAVALEHLLVAVAEDEFGDLRREEALEPAGAFDLRQLVGDALLERLVPACEIGRLRGDLVVQLLDPQHRFHARHQRHLVDRLGQILVGAGVEPGHDVLGVGLGGDQNDRHERQGLRRP